VLWQPGGAALARALLRGVGRAFKFLTLCFYLQEWGRWNVQIKVEHNVGIKQLFYLCLFFKQNTHFLPYFLIFVSR
jgi:hypothetical protein